MRLETRVLVVCGLMVMLFATAALAIVPRTMSYQGMLRDGDGNIVPDGTYEVTFSIRDAATGGLLFWSEIDAVAVTDGVFSTVLGDVSPINLPADRKYWLAIKVEDTAELSPRIELTSSPYAFVADAIDLPFSGSVDTAEVAFNIFNNGGTGIWGGSLDAFGVNGQSTNLIGVRGEGGQTGVYGTTDTGVGVWGFNESTLNYGALANSSFGVYGSNQATDNWGYFGSEECGVYGSSTNGYAGYLDGKAKVTSYLEVGGAERILGNVGPATGASLEMAYDSANNRGYIQAYNRDTATPGEISFGSNEVGFGVTVPARPVHIKDVMRLEPRSSYPASPSDGDLCVIGNTGSRHIFCYLNGTWVRLD